jgi:NADPH:quinone reductase
MRAAVIVDDRGPGAVRIVDLPEPEEPADGGVLVEVRAAGVSFPEVLQTRGRYQVQPPTPFVPGGEIAGVVRAAPSGSRLRPGDEVFAHCGVGGFAELAWAPEDLVFPLPSGFDAAEGAAFLGNSHSAWFALVARGRAVAGETVVVHGAAGGLGTAVVQLARALGLRVIAVVSSEAKAEAARAAGATEVVLAGAGWRDAVRALAPEGVELVVDPVGDRTIDSLRVLAELGRYVIVGFASGEIPTIPANRLLLRNLEAIGVVYGGYAFARPGYARSVQESLDPLVRAGALRPPIGARLPLERAAEALEIVESRRAIGKVVLETGQ